MLNIYFFKVGAVVKKILLFMLTLLLATNIYSSDEKIGTYERLGKFVPLDLIFMDENNQTKTLGQFMNNKPTVISVNYFHCPGICGPQIDALTKSLDHLDMQEGKEFNALTISFVTSDTSKDALLFKNNHTRVINKDFDATAWHFLVTDNNQTRDKLLQSLGYEYKKIVTKQGFTDYIHPTGLVIISPEGKITRYLEGIHYLPFDLKMALLESAKGTVRPTITRALAFCYSFDPKSSKYVIEYKKIFGVIVSVFLVIIFLYFYITGKRNQKRRDQEGEKIDE